MGIEFYDQLPGTQSERRDYFDFAEELIGHPGQWAILPTEGQSIKQVYARASGINSGNYRAFRVGFEAATRKGQLFVRFIGYKGEYK